MIILQEDFRFMREEYLDLLIECLENLDPEIVIHRITGDGPKDLLIAPLWASRKREVLNLLHHQMKEQNSYQGKSLKVSDCERTEGTDMFRM